MIKLEQIPPDLAKDLCCIIVAKLPGYFDLPEANEYYAEGVKTRTNIAAKLDGQYVGFVSIEFPYSTNASIFWMAILPEYHNQGIGKQLIESACNLAITKGSNTITVDTLSPKNADENYLKTYNFYLKNGFLPLFDLKPQDSEWNMVYMMKNIKKF